MSVNVSVCTNAAPDRGRGLADPKKFAHVRRELGIDPGFDDDTQLV
jgi:hypothetical protein